MGEFAKTFYRMDTDYDYYLLREVLKKYPVLGEEKSEDLVARFNVGGFLRSCVTVDKMTSEKLDEIFAEYEKCGKELSQYSMRKAHWMQITVGKYNFYFNNTSDESKQRVIRQMTRDGVLK
jgi:hypothetical protein